MATVGFHPAAYAEYRAALIWYAERGAQLGGQFAESFASALRRIGASPERWPAGARSTRRILLHRFPYLIHYRYDAPRDHIRIIAVSHSSREPSYWHRRK